MQGELTGALVGDAGYPALPFLFTPIGNPVSDEEQRLYYIIGNTSDIHISRFINKNFFSSYNNIHARTSGIVERTFGTWKRRFPCLSRGLSTKLLCSTTIVVACAVLHNLALIFNDKLPENEEEEEEYEVVPVNPPHWQPGDGFAVRAALIERLFQ
jgi:hypothetical protein